MHDAREKSALRRVVLPAVIAVGAALILSLWVGVPLFNKRQGDRMVDDLCAKEGGIHVYEAVELPASRIPANWASIPFQNKRKASDEFYFVHSTKDIRGNSNSTDIGALTVFRTE